MAEQVFNINFVRVVRKYPCVYDSTLREHNFRPVVEKAWHSIAQQVGENVKSCKERWKNIRTVFRREIVLWKGSSKKPYYLNEHLQFMLPFLSRRGRVIQINKDNFDPAWVDGLSENSNCNASEDYEEHTEEPAEDSSNMVETVSHDLPEIKRIFSEPIRIKVERLETEEEPETQEFVPPKTPVDQDRLSSSLPQKDWSNFEEYTPDDPQPLKKKPRTECSCISDPDQQFLLSLKPDLEQMNMEQKRRFKKGIFNLLADIMDNDPRSQPYPSSSSSYR